MTELSLDVNVQALFVASAGFTDAIRTAELPFSRLIDVSLNVTPVTLVSDGSCVLSATVTLHLALYPSSSLTARISAEPALIPVSKPSFVTVTTEGLLEVSRIFLLAAFAGCT